MTKKKHVSFSELSTFLDCPYRHKLAYIDQIEIEERESHYLHYGSILHDTVESFLTSEDHVMDVESCLDKLSDAWKKHGFDTPDYLAYMNARADHGHWKYSHDNLDKHIAWAQTCLSKLPNWLNEEFGEWECISAEEKLYELTEHIVNEEEFYFKGFVDALLKSRKPDKRGNVKTKNYVIDWKTSKARGWDRYKIQDIKTWGQVALYKKYWARRENLDLKDIRCAYVLLKKTKKSEKALQKIDISVGPKSIEKVEKALSSFTKSMNAKFHIKNKSACRFCEYRGTEHCDGVLYY